MKEGETGKGEEASPTSSLSSQEHLETETVRERRGGSGSLFAITDSSNGSNS